MDSIYRNCVTWYWTQINLDYEFIKHTPDGACTDELWIFASSLEKRYLGISTGQRGWTWFVRFYAFHGAVPVIFTYITSVAEYGKTSSGRCSCYTKTSNWHYRNSLVLWTQYITTECNKILNTTRQRGKMISFRLRSHITQPILMPYVRAKGFGFLWDLWRKDIVYGHGLFVFALFIVWPRSILPAFFSIISLAPDHCFYHEKYCHTHHIWWFGITCFDLSIYTKQKS